MPRNLYHQHESMTSSQKILIGALGATVPLVCNLLVLDLSVILSNLTVIAVAGYLIRLFSLAFLGGVVAWLHADEKSPVKLFELGIAAPALITALLNATNADVPKKNPLSFLVICPPAYAQNLTKSELDSMSAKFPAAEVKAPPESEVQQFFRGLTGSQNRDTWFVVVGVHTSAESAYKQLRAFKKQKLDTLYTFEVKTFNESDSTKAYIISIADNLPLMKASAIKRKAAPKFSAAGIQLIRFQAGARVSAKSE